jgi:Putative Flp pilus-assembly TadE/G-like
MWFPIGNFCRDRRANVVIVFGLTLPVVIGGAGLGVETSYWYYKDLELQGAADAAAFAGGIEKRSGSDDSTVTAEATEAAVQNGFDATIGTIVVNSPPLSGPNTGIPAVEVILDVPLDRFFSKIFLDGPVVANARAVGIFQTSSNACVLALDPSASKAALFSGSSSLTLNGCVIMANSIADDAVTAQGAANVEVDCLVSGGGAQLNAHVSMTECSSAIVNAPPVADPYASLPAPSHSGGCKNANGSTLSPGYYCHGMNLHGDVHLNDGVYYISGGDFKINANADITGDNVTIYLADDARVNMNGNAEVSLSAPISGVYSGILFFGDRGNSAGSGNKFNGTADSKLTGAIYFASQAVEYLGNFSGTSGCTRIVAQTVQWTGNATFNQDCSALGIPEIPAMQLVKLAE